MRRVLGAVALASTAAAAVACKGRRETQPATDTVPPDPVQEQLDAASPEALDAPDAGGRADAGSSVRAGAVSVNGRLPTEVVQRVVRQNFGRFRLCYVGGLGANPGLQGRVTVKFVIDRDGTVTSTADGGSDLPDQGVVKCVVRAFGAVTFPPPEAGIVTVVYPLFFTPPGPGSP